MTLSEPARIRVLGMGNVLMGDDGFGPEVVAEMARSLMVPNEIELVDVGTPGLNLTPFLSGPWGVVLVDVAEHDGAPGEVRVFSREEVLRQPAPARVSPHDPGLREALLALDFAGAGPSQFRLVAARPERVATGPGLSPALGPAIPEAIMAVISILADWQVYPRARIPPLADRPWWAPV